MMGGNVPTSSEQCRYFLKNEEVIAFNPHGEENWLVFSDFLHTQTIRIANISNA